MFLMFYHIFPHCLTKTAHLPENFIEQKMCVVIFPNIILETFLILRRIRRVVIINVHRSPRKVPLFLSDFDET